MKRQGKIEYRKRPPVKIVLSTFASRREAGRVARELVRLRLAACCNVIPGVTSFFMWEGKREEAKEVLLLTKTTSQQVSSALAYLKRHHPYDLPELIVLSLLSPSFLSGLSFLVLCVKGACLLLELPDAHPPERVKFKF